MKALEKEMDRMQKSIETEMKLIFKANMKIFDWDIPENDEQKAAKVILDLMQEALDKLKKEQLSTH